MMPPFGLDAPIFIGGLSHSGKTPLRRVLEAHPQLVFTRKAYHWLTLRPALGTALDEADLDRVASLLGADPTIGRLGPDLAVVRAALPGRSRSPDVVLALCHDDHARRSGARRWGVQLGMVEAVADHLFDAFPAAKLVHMVRDPRTRKAHVRGPQVGWERAKWIRSAELATRNRGRYPDRYLIVRYEDLAVDAEAAVEAVCRFLGESMTGEMRTVASELRLERAGGSADPLTRRSRDAMQSLGYADAFGEPTRNGWMSRSIERVPARLGDVAWRLTAGRRLTSLARVGGGP